MKTFSFYLSLSLPVLLGIWMDNLFIDILATILFLCIILVLRELAVSFKGLQNEIKWHQNMKSIVGNFSTRKH